jgi:tRNA(fMet)-specific endonuclease VapC
MPVTRRPRKGETQKRNGEKKLIFKQLREQGTPIPSNDIWIAALAIQYEMILGTRNKHFGHLPQIPCIQWDASAH